jgi:N utilization substance protein A
MNVRLYDEQGKTAEVVVPDKQLSLAIGKEGQNARLAAKLTTWRIDIKSASEAAREALDKAKRVEAIRARVADKVEIFNLVANIIEAKNPIDFSDGELNVISEAVEFVNLAEMAIERERQAEAAARAKAAKEAAKSRDILAEAEVILSGGQAQDAPSGEVQEAEVELSSEEMEAAAKLEETPDEVVELEVEAILEPEVNEVTVEEEVEAIVAEKVEPEPEPAKPTPQTTDELIAEAEAFLFAIPEEDDLDELEKARIKKEARQKKRRLVYDERLGEVVAERRRKRSRRSDDWLDYDEE